MAFTDPYANNNINWRGSTDSNRSSFGFDPRMSTDSVSVLILVDSLYLKINELDKLNARIKKSIISFKDSNQNQRRNARLLL